MYAEIPKNERIMFDLIVWVKFVECQRGVDADADVV